jgi:hypothetical protein
LNWNKKVIEENLLPHDVEAIKRNPLGELINGRYLGMDRSAKEDTVNGSLRIVVYSILCTTVASKFLVYI